jgi:hypothetical protein
MKPALRSHPGLSVDTTACNGPLVAGSDGQLVVKHGKSSYLENNLWTNVKDEFQDSQDILGNLQRTRVKTTGPKATCVESKPTKTARHGPRSDRLDI